MSSIPSNAATSVAQSQLTQAQRSAEASKPREAAASHAQRLKRQRINHHESVEDTPQINGLAVDPDAGNDQQDGKPGHQQPDDDAPAQTPDPTGPATQADARARSAALLADPAKRDDRDRTPPPLILDVEA